MLPATLPESTDRRHMEIHPTKRGWIAAAGILAAAWVFTPCALAQTADARRVPARTSELVPVEVIDFTPVPVKRIRRATGTEVPQVVRPRGVAVHRTGYQANEPRLSQRRAASTSSAVRQVSGESIATQILDVPKAPIADSDQVRLNGEPELMTLSATGVELTSVLKMIAEHHGLNLVLGPDVRGPVTVSIRDARMDEVLDAILGVAGFRWHRVDNLLYVTGASATAMDPRVQGRTVQVFPLDYVAAADVESIARSLLSPVGTAFISESDTANQLKTRELLVIEDIPAVQRRVAEFVAQVNVPPRQVLVEAHVLQIALSDDQRHGINLRALARLGHTKVTVAGENFTDSGDTPTLALQLEGTDMSGLLQNIRENTNSRTLASPKLSVVNHQEANIQIGERLPYTLSTTTQTSTIESVAFLDTGIVLTVVPVITDDGNVLMTVLPKVSSGSLDENGLPQENTTEVSTTILIPDGGGVVIGGLISEEKRKTSAVIPTLSRIPLLGRLFERKSDECRRSELIVALVTHVLPCHQGPRAKEYHDLQMTLPPYAAEALRARPTLVQPTMSRPLPSQRMTSETVISETVVDERRRGGSVRAENTRRSSQWGNLEPVIITDSPATRN